MRAPLLLPLLPLLLFGKWHPEPPPRFAFALLFFFSGLRTSSILPSPLSSLLIGELEAAGEERWKKALGVVCAGGILRESGFIHLSFRN